MSSGLGFSKQHRLLSATDYEFVFSAADIKASCPQMLLLARFNRLKYPRLGLVIAKKHVKQAVDRNRLKRQIRESFRLRQHDLPNIDIVVLARAGCASLDNNSFHHILEKQWQRLSLRAVQHRNE